MRQMHLNASENLIRHLLCIPNHLNTFKNSLKAYKSFENSIDAVVKLCDRI